MTTLNQYSAKGRAAILKQDSRGSLDAVESEEDRRGDPFLDSEARDIKVLKKLHEDASANSRGKVNAKTQIKLYSIACSNGR